MDPQSVGAMIPLQALRSDLSSENTSQNSNAAEERRTQITADLASGVTECAVCSETLNIYTGIWSCQDCHNLFHHNCIHKWASRSGRFAWPCPACKALQADPGHFAKCWCGKAEKHSLYRPHGIFNGNSCGKKCQKIRNCPERTCGQMCEQTCHPGSCDEVKCNIGCKNFGTVLLGKKDKMPVVVGILPREPRSYRHGGIAEDAYDGQPPNPDVQPRIRRPQAPGWCQRLGERWSGVTWCDIIGPTACLIMMCVFQGLGAIWAVKRAERVNLPLQHQEYTEGKGSGGEVWALILVGIGFIILPSVFFGTFFALSADALVMKTFAMPPKGARQIFFGTLLLIIVVANIPSFITMQVVIPMKAWDKQFEHSCDTFDTGMKFDKQIQQGKSSYNEVLDAIQLYDPRLGTESFDRPGINLFNFSRPFDISKRQTDNFYSFHRMIGTTNTRTLAVDFDLQHHAWRMLDLSPTSITNSIQTLENIALLTETGSKLIKNGTWNKPSWQNPHLSLPELDLLIPAFRHFTRKGHYQPFMKVYNTSGLSPAQVKDVSWRQWSGENEEGVVMRTMKLSMHGPLRLCYRNGDYNAIGPGGNEEVRKGMGDDGLVPLGLMAAIRIQMEKDRKDGR